MKAIRYLVDAKFYKESWRNYSAPPRHEPDATVESFPEILDILE